MTATSSDALKTGRPAHLHWVGADSLPPQVREALIGPGAPFALGPEAVLGHENTVFHDRPRSLRTMFERYTADVRDLPFLVSPERTWTYAEALVDIDALAHLLRERYGVRSGDRVAVVAANSAEYAIVMWATVTLGAVLTSLNGWWTAPELQHGISLTDPVLVTGDARRLARLHPEAAGGPAPVVLIDDLVAQAREHRGQAPGPAELDEDAPAVILFTSGTTGRPKGATLSHRNIVNFGMVSALGAAIGAASGPAPDPSATLPAQQATILTSPMFHISGLVAVFLSGVVFHTKLIFTPPGKWDPGVYLALTEQHGVTMWSGVPTHYWRLLRHPELATFDLSSIQTVGAGGAVFPPELVRELHERFPNIRLGNGYGMSETVGLGTQTGGDLFVEVPESVGAATPTVEVQVRDEMGALLSEGEIGEICLRSPSVFLGYWDDPRATEESLDPERWYRTGDYGRISSGLLFLESRRRDLILRAGENVYPIEIENRLVEHPDIDDAAVIGVDHPELGQEVKAFVVVRAGARVGPDDVREWCGLALAAFKIPTQVEFRDVLPYNATGKLLKSELERQGQELRPQRQ